MVNIRKNSEFAMIAAASRALEIKAAHPGFESEEILKEVVKSMQYGRVRSDVESNIGAVAAVDRVLKLKREFPKYTNKQLVQKLVDDSKKSFVNSEGE